MADNLAVTPGTGATIGMDEVTDGTLGTVKVGYGKIMDGALGGTNKAGVTSNNALQVDISQTNANSTAIKVDGSGVTQPVSGTVTANAGTNLNTSALALESGGNLAAIKSDSDSIVTNTSNTATNTTNIPNVIGTAGSATPSKGLVVQGSDYGGTAKAQTLKVDSSGNAQVAITNTPTVTANAGTNLNTSALALETGGNLATTATNTGTIAGAVSSSKMQVNVTNTSIPVTQSTASNLNATVVGTGTFAVQDSTTETNTGNIATNTTPLTSSSAGGYVRQDSTGTIAKETGGNLATVATNTTGVAKDATLTGGTQQSKLTNGTNIADVITPGTPIANGNALLAGWTAQASTAYSLTAAGTSSVIDMSNFASVSFQVTSQYTISGGTSTVTAQWSNDNTNWYTAIIQSASTSSPTTSTNTTGVWTAYKAGRYFRLNITGTYVSGTAAGLIIPSTSPIAYVPSTGSTITGSTVLTTGTITTSSSSIVTGSLTGYPYVIVSVHGTYAGVTFGITVSDDSGTTFYNASAYDITNNKLVNSASITPSSNASNLYLVSIPPVTGEVKVLASAYTSGTANIRIGASVNTPPALYSNTFLTDAAGNNRGANVNAANQLTVIDQTTPAATALNTYSVQITSKTTTTPTASTAYISSITISQSVAGTAETITIQDKQGTPIVLVSALGLTALTAPVTYNFQTPVKMVSGIDIITGGTTAGTTNVFLNYYQ